MWTQKACNLFESLNEQKAEQGPRAKEDVAESRDRKWIKGEVKNMKKVIRKHSLDQSRIKDSVRNGAMFFSISLFSSIFACNLSLQYIFVLKF